MKWKSATARPSCAIPAWRWKSARPRKCPNRKSNVIAPEEIIDVYGADTIRWFMLSDTPPERDIEWTDAGAEGCWRFVQRIWRLAGEGEGLAGHAGRG